MLYLLMYFCLAFTLLAGILFVVSRCYHTEEEEKREKTNKRQRFRLTVYNVKCDYLYEPGSIRAYGSLIDISSTGVQLHTFQDIPENQEGDISVSFTLGGVTFSIKGAIVRKKKQNDYRYAYGIQFLHANEKEHELLFQTIWNESKKRVAI